MTSTPTPIKPSAPETIRLMNLLADCLFENPISLSDSMASFDRLLNQIKHHETAFSIADVSIPCSSHDSHVHEESENDLNTYPLLIHLISRLEDVLPPDEASSEDSLEPSDFERPYVQLMDHILSQGYPVDTSNSMQHTPLHFAVCRQFLFFMPTLLKYQANVNALDCDGESPVTDAVRTNQLVAFHLMAPHQADLFIKNNGQKTLLHYVVSSPSDGTEMARILLDSGIDIESRADNGLTALHFAALQNRPDMVRFFISRGAHMDAQDDQGMTALHMSFTCLESLQVLVEQGADLHIENEKGETLLKMAQTLTYTPRQCLDYLEHITHVQAEQLELEKTLPSLTSTPTPSGVGRVNPNAFTDSNASVTRPSRGRSL